VATTRQRTRSRPPRSAGRRRKRRAGRSAGQRNAVVVLSVVTVIAIAYLLFFSSLLGVSAVEVSGLHRLSEASVLRKAGVAKGTPLLRVDTAAAERRIAELPEVAAVTVGRSLPSTITIDVVERVPLAYLKGTGGAQLVDRTGKAFHRVDKPPKNLPELRLTRPRPADPATKAAMAVLDGMPEKLREQVRVIQAGSPDDVQFTLAGGKRVRWGSARQGAVKAQVLAALLSQPGTVYDVSSPELPTVR